MNKERTTCTLDSLQTEKVRGWIDQNGNVVYVSRKILIQG
jgi:hypothetical protein